MADVQLVQDVGQDEILAGLVALAAESDLTAPLTLVVPGGVVRGTLVGPARWLAELEDLLGRSGDGGKALAGRLEAITLQAELDRGAEDAVPHRYVHLRAARLGPPRMLQGDGPGLLWRGRLSQISGWAFGSA